MRDPVVIMEGSVGMGVLSMFTAPCYGRIKTVNNISQIHARKIDQYRSCASRRRSHHARQWPKAIHATHSVMVANTSDAMTSDKVGAVTPDPALNAALCAAVKAMCSPSILNVGNRRVTV